MMWGKGAPLSSTQPHTGPGRFVTLPSPRPHAAAGANTATSRNWSGQIAGGTTFSGISARWVVPAVQPSTGNNASATWIGIDGGPNSPASIIQTGTTQGTQGGAPVYFAWYEIFPQPAVVLGPVSPGDQMEAEVYQNSGTDWRIDIVDVTSGYGSGLVPVTYNGPGASAEWIEELPTVENGPQVPLANFGTATFTNLQLMVANPASVGLVPVDMIDAGGNVMASAGAISNGSFTITYVPVPHGYWLVGSDGGIFTFGSAQFYGSTGSLKLQRPVVGIVPTADRGGYWLDASDGGVFAFGDTQFYGSIPGLGLNPARSGLPHSLNAPIVGMVPSVDDGGYFMVASDGGVFAFGDAHFAGSCPGIGGCSGTAVAVMPDHSGNGYWVVTATGNIYTFGDAPYFGAPGHGTVTSAVATPDGEGYWVLLSNGTVLAYGSAANLGSPPSSAFTWTRCRDRDLRDRRRRGLLGLIGPGQRLQLRGRPSRRGHGGDPSERDHHRRHRVLTVPPASAPAPEPVCPSATFAKTLKEPV